MGSNREKSNIAIAFLKGYKNYFAFDGSNNIFWKKGSISITCIMNKYGNYRGRNDQKHEKKCKNGFPMP